MAKVDYMCDCPRCALQNWKKLDNNKFKCDECEISVFFPLESNGGGEDCIVCGCNTWDIIEETDDHTIFECTNCKISCEVWLKEN